MLVEELSEIRFYMFHLWLKCINVVNANVDDKRTTVITRKITFKWHLEWHPFLEEGLNLLFIHSSMAFMYKHAAGLK